LFVPAVSSFWSSIARSAAIATIVMTMKSAFVALALAGVKLVAGDATKTFTLPDVLHDGPVSEETAIADPAWIDAPKLSSASNDTTYEWCAAIHARSFMPCLQHC
jgi:hypothetical protein